MESGGAPGLLRTASGGLAGWLYKLKLICVASEKIGKYKVPIIYTEYH